MPLSEQQLTKWSEESFGPIDNSKAFHQSAHDYARECMQRLSAKILAELSAQPEAHSENQVAFHTQKMVDPYKRNDKAGDESHPVGYDQHKECDRKNFAEIARLNAENKELRASAQPEAHEWTDEQKDVLWSACERAIEKHPEAFVLCEIRAVITGGQP